MSKRIALTLLAFLGACKPAAPDPQLVAQWLRTSLAFVRSERLGPPVAARVSAYSSIAMYEAYAADPNSHLRTLAGQLNGVWTVPGPTAGDAIDGATAAAEAQRVVFDSLFSEGFPSTRRTIDSLASAQIEARQRAGVKGDLRERSITHGKNIGSAILAWAATDGFFATRGRPWTPPTTPDKWVNTATTDQFVAQQLSAESDVVLTKSGAPTADAATASTRNVFANRPKEANPKTTLPQFNPLKPTEPYWGTLRTFALRNGDECAPPPPPAYSTKPGSPFWKMGREFFDSAKTPTDTQKAIAFFWTDNPVATGTPGFHWISVVNQMITKRHLSADQAAEAYMLTSVAIADAFIGCWKEKYRSMVVRPVTYVHRVFDPKWNTLFGTPPFPEYPSGHSTLSGAAVGVLIHLLGDSTAFTDSTQVDIGVPARSFRNFTHALDEVAMSRVYGGIHYMPAVMLGKAQGLCIAEKVYGRLKTRS
jgi:membrane-associated phospholipid phosphatase